MNRKLDRSPFSVIPQAPRVGIGVITYNRRERLHRTLAELRQHTVRSCSWVVADDGSTDHTLPMVWECFPDMATVTGRNLGVAWNRNRALWWLHIVQRCDVCILIEDDTFPTRPGWEEDWVAAAGHHGHINLAGEWFSGGFVRGCGTVEDPVVSMGVSGQLSAFSGDALNHVGFYDTRYQGYGMGHVEHTFRMVRAGYGGVVITGAAGDFDGWQLRRADTVPAGMPEALFYLLRSPIEVINEDSHGEADPTANQRNVNCFTSTVRDQVYRPPWSCDGQMVEFRAEIAAARRSRPIIATAIMRMPRAAEA